MMDEISSLEWDIVPKDGFEYEWVEEGIKKIKEFLQHPNHNNESFSSLVRKWIKDILEIDAASIVKVFDIGSYDFNEIEPKSGAPLLKPIGQRRMTELYVMDGASFLREIDKFSFISGYWQYCITGKNIIETTRGFINADEAIKGDKVLGNDGKYHEILDNYSRTYSGDFFRIKAQGVPMLSLFHPIPAHANKISVKRPRHHAPAAIVADNVRHL